MTAPAAAEQTRGNRTWDDRAGAVLAGLWLLATGGMGVRLALRVANTNLDVLIAAACVVYLAVFIRYFYRAGPVAANLPNLQPIAFRGLSFRVVLGIIVGWLGLLFALSFVLHPWLILGAAFALVALGLAVARRRRLNARLIGLSVAAGVVVALATRIRYTGGYSAHGIDFLTLFYAITVPLMFIGGGLLLDYTGLAHIRALEGRYALALRGFLRACVLAVPPAILNILGGSQAADKWVTDWRGPWYAIVPGIAEETWARLFLTTFAYALLRPTTNDRPQRAVVAAVLIGALTHGLAHLPMTKILSLSGATMIVAGLMYGVPLGLLFIKRDLEHAIGNHFFVDFVRFGAALYQFHA